MALEAGVVYIDDLVAANPVGATDFVDEGDDHIRNIKTAVKGSFPNLGAAAVTGTAAELNYVDVAAAGTAEASKALVLDGSLDVAGINSLTATALVGALTGNADTVTTNANLTGDVTSVGNAASIAANAIGETALKTNTSTAGSLACTGSTTTLVPAGLYTFTDTVASSLKLDVNSGGWRLGADVFTGGTVFSDGTNVRFTNSSPTLHTLYFVKLA